MPPRRPPKRITEARLRRIVAHYLERYSTTSSNLRRLMMQRVHRAAAHHGEDPSVGEALVDAEVARVVALGLVNDAAYARDRARALVRRGNGPRLVRAKLRAKGVRAADIDAALDAVEEELGDPARRAVRAYARKRRLGPWAVGPVDRDTRQKHLAKLARAGFSYDLAREVVDAESTDALDLP